MPNLPPHRCNAVILRSLALSCALLRSLAYRALGNATLELRATDIPTAKNNMVFEHYGRLGFTLLSEDGQGVRSYNFDMENYLDDDL